MLVGYGMNKQQGLERVVELAADMKLRLTNLLKLYASLEPVIHQEHAAIAEGDIGVIAICQQNKTAATDAVDAEFGMLQDDCRQIAAMRATWCPALDSAKTVTLKQTLSYILDLSEALSGGALGEQLVLFQLRNVEELLENFDARVKQVQPLLEMNMYIVSKMLTNIQQSYKFHISLVEEESSAYTEKGVKKTDGTHSGFKVGV